MVKISKYSSYIRLISLICIAIVVGGITLIMSITLFVPTTVEVFRAYIFLIYSSLSFQLIVEIVVRIIFITDRRKLVFTQECLIIGENEYLYKDLKLMYFGVNIESILCLAPGKFKAIYKENDLILGYYLPIEIRNIRRKIKDIIIY